MNLSKEITIKKLITPILKKEVAISSDDRDITECRIFN